MPLKANMVLLVLPFFAGAGSHAALLHLGAPPDAPAAGCQGSPCTICVPSNCQLGEGQYLVEDPNYDHVVRCVEYDHEPPPHCAQAIKRTHYWIYDAGTPDPVGDCYTMDCANGEPTSSVCTNPWYRDPPTNSTSVPTKENGS